MMSRSLFRTVSRLIGGLVSSVILSTALFAQGVNSSVVGTVTDATGAVVPGVQVVAINVNTGVRSTATTDGAGNYRVPYLQPGSYSLEAEANGFKRFVRQNITLDLDRERALQMPVVQKNEWT